MKWSVPKDKIQHYGIGLVVAMPVGWEVSPAYGLAAGVAVSLLIELWQWTGNRLLEWKPALFGRWLKVRCPDTWDAIAGTFGALTGALISFLIR